MALLFPTTILEWNTKHPGKRMNVARDDLYLLNTNRICEMRVSGTNDSRFLYSNDPDDRRDSPDRIKSDSSVAVITSFHDAEPFSKFGTFPIFPDMDVTETPVDTTIEFKDIAYLWQTPRDYDDEVTHMVYYPKAWERVKCIVDASLADIYIYTLLGIWP